MWYLQSNLMALYPLKILVDCSFYIHFYYYYYYFGICFSYSTRWLLWCLSKLIFARFQLPTFFILSNNLYILCVQVFANHEERCVRFTCIGTWLVGEGGPVKFTIDSDVVTSTWDYVALYKVFKHLCDVFCSFFVISLSILARE